jgi:hypothetical protein
LHNAQDKKIFIDFSLTFSVKPKTTKQVIPFNLHSTHTRIRLYQQLNPNHIVCLRSYIRLYVCAL